MIILNNIISYLSKKLDFKIKDEGFLEAHSSVRNIRGKAIEEIKKGKKTIITDMVKNDIKKITPYIVCEAAVMGDKLANSIITDMVEILSVGIINLILIVNPQLVVLGGDFFNLPEVSKLFIKPVTEKVRRCVPFVIRK